MKRIFLLLVSGLLVMASCGNSKDKAVESKDEALDPVAEQTEELAEPEVLMPQSIEVVVDGEHMNTLKLKYDSEKRLVDITGEEEDEFRKITYSSAEVKVKEAYSETTYKYADGKLADATIDMGENGNIFIKYDFDGDKISKVERSFDFRPGCSDFTTYKWKDGCIVEVSTVSVEEGEKSEPSAITYKYSDVQNSLPFDLFSLVDFYTDASLFDQSLISKLMPSESHFDGVVDGYIPSAQTTTYEYAFDQEGRLSIITVKFEGKDGEEGEEYEYSTEKIIRLKY